MIAVAGLTPRGSIPLSTGSILGEFAMKKFVGPQRWSRNRSVMVEEWQWDKAW